MSLGLDRVDVEVCCIVFYKWTDPLWIVGGVCVYGDGGIGRVFVGDGWFFGYGGDFTCICLV